MNEKQQLAARVVLFVGLTLLVFQVTAKVFRGPPVPVPVVQTIDSTTGLPAGTQPGVTIPPPISITTPTPAPVASALTATPAQAAIDAPPVDSVIMADSVVSFTLTNRGASVVRAELLRHRTLGADSGRVQLLREGEPLARYLLNVNGQNISLANLPFMSEIVRGANGAVEMVRYSTTLAGSETRVILEYTQQPGLYVVQVRGRLENAAPNTLLVVELPSGLASGEANIVEDERHFALAYRFVRGDVKGLGFGKLDAGEIHRRNEAPISWVAVKSKYFMTAILKPEGDSTGFRELNAVGGARISRAATHVNTFVVDDAAGGRIAFDLFAGPQEYRRLAALGREFENSNPYGGWLQPIVQPFAVIVMQSLLWLRETTKLEYGWVLVIFGVIVRLLLWPLNQRAMRTSMRMQRIQPELTEVQTKYKGNPQKQQEEIMRVYKDHGMTPFSPLAGCLPMLIPMPVFFALFFVFQNTIEFRGVPFLWLPDISLKDPYYIVPVFMGVSMFVMSWIGARAAPQNPQTKMMLYILPIMMTVLFLNFASGLNLYYAVQNVAALPQQWLISRERVKSAGAAGTAVVQGPGSGGRGTSSSSSGKKGKG